MIIAEVWGALGGFDDREISVINSGPIPRMFKLPIAICQIFGKNLRKDGSICDIDKKSVNLFKKWFEATNKSLPAGSIQIQSSTYHTWP